VFVPSGGLSGPDERLADPPFEGSLDGTSVLVGVGDADERVPVERVRRTAGVFRSLGGDATERVYPGVAHEVADEAFAAVGDLLDGLPGSAAGPARGE
jgi:phospholipase/carboxylesterase